MAKLETPAAVSAGLRPPRPAVRMRAGAAVSEGSEAAELGDAAYASHGSEQNHYSESRYPESHYPGALGPEGVEVLELEDDEVVAEPADGAEPHLSEEAVTERGFDASTFGLPRAGGTKLPMASLEMPSASRLDLTPSPVPRVALSPATGAVDISLVPGPHASRNLPTLAAHHVLGRRPARRPASAITFPPHQAERGGSLESPRLGAGLAKDVRSSKREIVLGLAIGLGLSLVLAAVGQAYLREGPVASSPPPEVESLALSAKPAAAAPSAADDAQTAPASSEHAVAEPVARAAVDEGADPAFSVDARSRRGNVAGDGLGEPARVPSASRAAAMATSYSARSPSARSATEPVAGRAYARRVGASPAAGQARAASGPQQGSGKPHDSIRAYDEPPRAPQAPASVSPAESAGLGLDLPL